MAKRKTPEQKEDERFLEWIRTLPSCLSGQFNHYVHGEGRSIAAHVRRSAEAGTGYKPLLSAVPLTFEQHNDQSWHGESYCLNKHLGGLWSVAEAKDFFTEQADRYRSLWRELHG